MIVLDFSCVSELPSTLAPDSVSESKSQECAPVTSTQDDSEIGGTQTPTFEKY